jgi:hypothetical protein
MEREFNKTVKELRVINPAHSTGSIRPEIARGSMIEL